MNGRRAAGFLLCFCTLMEPAMAQTDQDRAGARAAAGEGIQAFQEGKYEEALRLLERAQSLVDAPTHLLFIARSQVKLGKLVEAREAYKKIITANLPDDAPKAFLQAQEAAPVELAEIEARLAKIRIDVAAKGGEELVDLVVTLNGVPMSSALVGVSVPANPGKNEISVSARGMLPVTRTVELTEGGSDKLEISLVVDPNAPTEPSAEPAEESEPADESSPSEPQGPNRKRTAGFVTLGVGAAVTITGGVFGALSLSQLGKAKSDESLCGADKQCTPDGRDDVDSAQTKALVADIALGVGLVAVGVGTYLVLTSKPDPQKVGVRSFSPSLGPQGGFLSLEGGF